MITIFNIPFFLTKSSTDLTKILVMNCKTQINILQMNTPTFLMNLRAQANILAMQFIIRAQADDDDGDGDTC